MLKKLIVILMVIFHFKIFADLESENNNSEISADTLTSGVAMTGRLSNSEDWDYFKLIVNSTEDLNLRFESPNSSQNENQWLVGVQEPRNNYLIFQETLSPSEGSPVDKTIPVTDKGTFVIFVAPVLGSNSAPITEYKLTITPKNFQAASGAFNGLWQDDKSSSFYSLHESLEGLLYLELKKDGTTWKAYFGGRLGNTATLDQVIGPGTAKLELTFVSNEKVEARYKSCRTNLGKFVMPTVLYYIQEAVFSQNESVRL